MKKLPVSDDGYFLLLNCPRCGEICEEMPANEPEPPYDFPHWEEGDTGVCSCGASLEVRVDGERAYLIDMEENES